MVVVFGIDKVPICVVHKRLQRFSDGRKDGKLCGVLTRKDLMIFKIVEAKELEQKAIVALQRAVRKGLESKKFYKKNGLQKKKLEAQQIGVEAKAAKLKEQALAHIECVKVSNMFIGLKKTCLGLFERCDSIEDIQSSGSGTFSSLPTCVADETCGDTEGERD